jgi:hypothetical protein
VHLAFVGALAEDAKLALNTGEETRSSFAGRLGQEHHEQLKEGAAPLFRKHTIC